MIVQSEDCIDVLQYLFPEFDFKFIFDHLNGHNRLQSDGLSLSKINVRHGGKQLCMRMSELKSEHFGPFHSPEYKLQPGMKQSMTYNPTDKGPCYFTETQRLLHCYNISTQEKSKSKN